MFMRGSKNFWARELLEGKLLSRQNKKPNEVIMGMLELSTKNRFISINIKRSNLQKKSLHSASKYKDTHLYDASSFFSDYKLISDCIHDHVEKCQLDYSQAVESILLSYSVKFSDFVKNNPECGLKEIQEFTRKWVQDYLAPAALTYNRP